MLQDAFRSPGIPLNEGTRQFFESRLPSPHSRPPSGIQSKSRIVPSTDSSEREAHQVSEGIFGQRPLSGGATRDLTQVRVHADGAAAASAKAIHADAYAAGSHLVFAQGKFSPQTRDGQRLLAHELMHVLQQQDAGSALGTNPTMQRRDDGSGSNSDDDDNKKPGEEKPKSSAEPDDPDSTGISLKYEKGKLVYCGSILGHEVCSDTPEKVKDAMRKMGKKKPPFVPDDRKCPGRMNPINGKCCPENNLWDDEKKKCAPFRTEPPAKCAPFEWPNTLYPGCCKPGDSDKPGCHRVPGPIIPHAPDAPVKPDPGNVPGTPDKVPPPSQTILHFQFDLPSQKAGKDEATLLKSLVPEDRGKWSSLLSDLEKNPSWKFQLVGHTSPEGDKGYNHALGERRALLVKSVLDAKKLGEHRVADVNPECDAVSNGIYNCGDKDATGPEDRQVKVVFDQGSGSQAQPQP
jgi:hypothetical protein